MQTARDLRETPPAILAACPPPSAHHPARELGRRKAPVAARRDGRRTNFAVANSPVKGRLADTEEPGRPPRADELAAAESGFHFAGELLNVFGQKPPVPT